MKLRAARAVLWKLILAWLAGVLGTFLLFRVAYGMAGLWQFYLLDVHRAFTDATGDNRFGPWATL
jgi:hypothetical protein